MYQAQNRKRSSQSAFSSAGRPLSVCSRGTRYSRRQARYGPHPAFSPTPYGGAKGPDAAGDLRPRQARFLLEPLQPLREALGEGFGPSVVVNALSRHRAVPSAGRIGTFSDTDCLTVHLVRPGWGAGSPHPVNFRSSIGCPFMAGCDLAQHL